MNENLGTKIREFLRALFGSRMANRLEFDIERMRTDCDERIKDFKIQIAELKTEKALLQSKIMQYEAVVMPLSSKAGADLKRPMRQPSFAESFADVPKSAWQAKQEEFDRLQNEDQNSAETAKKEKSR